VLPIGVEHHCTLEAPLGKCRNQFGSALACSSDAESPRLGLLGHLRCHHQAVIDDQNLRLMRRVATATTRSSARHCMLG
jgi:hypothetical protein